MMNDNGPSLIINETTINLLIDLADGNITHSNSHNNNNNNNHNAGLFSSSSSSCYYHAHHGGNKTGDTCSNGRLIPLWQPSPVLMPTSIRAGRAVFLVIVMSYLFLGISIISDKFVEAIQVVVSQKRRVRVESSSRAGNDLDEFIYVPIWNETVAHLTLAVVGSCSPEIMLTLVEVLTHNFTMGELGPATIVGSGAYNLFIITAVCILSVKRGQTSRIKDMHIFFVTCAWAIFAYVWLYLMISVISPGTIEVWEALVTFACFPMTILTSYLANKQCFGLPFYLRQLKRRSTITPSSDKENRHHHHHNGSVVTNNNRKLSLAFHLANNLKILTNRAAENCRQSGQVTTDTELQNVESSSNNDATIVEEEEEEECGEDEKPHQRIIIQQRENRFLQIEAELRKKFPNKQNEDIYEMAEMQLVQQLPKSRSYYRSQGLRRWSGCADVITRKKLKETVTRAFQSTITESTAKNKHAEMNDPKKQLVYFNPTIYTVVENGGHVVLSVARAGQDLNNLISVRYVTEAGTGKDGADYCHVDGKIFFRPGETVKQIRIEIVDDEVFKEDTVFYVTLFEPTASASKGVAAALMSFGGGALSVNTNNWTGVVEVDKNAARATVTKLDDDHGGVFHFETSDVTFEESIGEANLRVIRSAGGKGDVIVPVRVITGTAQPNEQYKDPGNIELTFNARQTEKFVKLRLIDEGKLNKQATLQVLLGEPRWSSVQNDADVVTANFLGAPRLRPPSKVNVTIVESSRLKRIVDDLAQMDVFTNFVATTSWREQFKAAITVSGGQADEQTTTADDDDDERNNGGRHNNHSSNNNDSEQATLTPKPKLYDYVLHVTALFWKLLMAFCPPTGLYYGWPAGLFCLVTMAFVTAIVADLAEQLGCTIGLPDELTAITFVSLGTSLPDMFASRIAAKTERTADAAIGHISGAAAVNVFFGIGMAWTIAAIKHQVDGQKFAIKAGSLAFSVTLYFTFAAITILVLMLRRLPPIKGELGGPVIFRILTVLLFFGFWIIYVGLSALDNYCIITTF